MKKVVAVGSQNPVKVKAVLNAFQKCFKEFEWEAIGIEVKSGVSNQPMSDGESIRGARNRASRAFKKVSHAEYAVGVEGGLQQVGKHWFDCGWIVIMDKNGNLGIGSTVKTHTPAKMMKLVLKGHELGIVDDMMTGRKNSKHAEGHMGIMSKGHITREDAYTDGVIMALARFLNPEFFT